MILNSDQLIFWEYGFVRVNATLAFTWIVMLGLAGGAFVCSRRLRSGADISRWQNLLEVLVVGMRDQIRVVSQQNPGPYLPFIGTIFLFVLTANVLAIVPGYRPPTGSLSTTAALALCVFISVPLYGVGRRGFRAYFRQYLQPTPLMLPFNVIGEITRTFALAVRLYGNVMSGTVLAAVLLGLTPLFFPVVMQLLGLLTGVIQAYIFALLAMVYIASATTVHQRPALDQAAAEESREPLTPDADGD